MGFLRPRPKEKGIKGMQGAETEAIIEAELIRAGYTVLRPNGYMHRYDLVIEDADGNFWKLQCKTAWPIEDGACLVFATSSLQQAGQRGRKISVRKSYTNDVHYFAVYSPHTGKVYLVPVEETAKSFTRLRLRPATKNGQQKRIKYAEDYEL